jgi:GMP synthase-like glutamine amidotransferase
MRKFLVIAPDALAPAGVVGTSILDLGAYYDTLLPIDRYASYSPNDYPGIPAEPGPWSGLIVLGGAMSANDGDSHPFLTEVAALMRGFEAADKPVLGICLGAQIMARAYGGEVYRLNRVEAGFHPVELTREGAQDPLFAGLGPSLTVYQSHFEAVRGMAGVTLATGKACPIQAFRVGRAAYAMQFHLEVNLDIARDWMRSLGPKIRKDEPFLATDLDRQFQQHFTAHRALCDTVLGRWVALAG